MTYLATVTGFFFIVSKNPAKKQKQTQQKHKKMKLNESKQKVNFFSLSYTKTLSTQNRICCHAVSNVCNIFLSTTKKRNTQKD